MSDISHQKTGTADTNKKSKSPPEKTDHISTADVTMQDLSILQTSDILMLQRTLGNKATIEFLDHYSSDTHEQALQRENDSLATGSDKAKRLYKKSKDLNEFAKQMIKLSESVKDKGTNTFWWDDKSMLEMARNIQDMASNVMAAANKFHELAKDAESGTFTRIQGHLDTLDKYLTVAEKLDQLAASQGKMKAFIDDLKDFDKAKAWASDVGNTFKIAADFVPETQPKFIGEHFKNLLLAPSRYIGVVVALIEDRRNKIDSLTDGEDAKVYVLNKGQVEWRGPLSPIALAAQGTKFMEFMLKHRFDNGKDLQKMSESAGLATLKALVTAKAEPQYRESWLKIIEKNS